ncbi:Chromodomain-helicase-DNA-binding protein 1-like [Sciurus carolinensis]|uniref:Chromodomain-helicase-DNA-binding protein 1-like n=1 Tax=Sciurus carolinensis TaxID=30640 RepID=A0AA41T390_SCICA|nr:Chromodomain-helicase-DNA-binding protein 1-like [Sciurus carolinensis]
MVGAHSLQRLQERYTGTAHGDAMPEAPELWAPCCLTSGQLGGRQGLVPQDQCSFLYGCVPRHFVSRFPRSSDQERNNTMDFISRQRELEVKKEQMEDFVQCYQILKKSKSSYSYEHVNGSVRGEERHLAMKNFGQQPSFIFLLNTRAGGIGINLTAADTVIFVDSDFSPQNVLQATSRVHQIGHNKRLGEILKFGLDKLLSSEGSTMGEIDLESILEETKNGQWVSDALPAAGGGSREKEEGNDSGHWGRGGLFTVPEALSTEPRKVYELAGEMKGKKKNRTME